MVNMHGRVPIGRHNRRGVSLIEMVVVISMMTVVIGLVGMTFHLLLRSERAVSQSFLTERTISRLAIQFRDDVHQSNTGVLTGGSESKNPVLTLENPSGIQIRYVVTGDGVVRLVVTGDRVTARDDFRLPDCRSFISAGPDEESSLRRLVIERPGAVLVKKQLEAVPLRAMNIDAYLERKERVAKITADIENDSVTEKRSLEIAQ